MNIVKSLERKVDRRGSLTKLKLDLSKPQIKNIDKIIKFLGKDLDKYDLSVTPLSEYLEFDNFNFEITEVNEKNIKSKISKTYSKNGSENEDLFNIKITNNDGTVFLETYTLSNVEIPYKNRGYNFRVSGVNNYIKVIDIKYIYGAFKLMDIIIEEVKSKKEFYLSKDFNKVSLYEKSYEEDILEKLLTFMDMSRGSYLCLIGISQSEYMYNLGFIIDVIAIMKNLDLNKELSDKYNEDSQAECARAFETKKNIPEKILKVMNNNKFLKEFSYVEVDEGTDLNKFNIISNEWIKTSLALDLKQFFVEDKPELRFRKLGKHRALGLYYPTLRCVCVDISSPSSFIHEIGHYIDYTYEQNNLSSKIDFYPIIREYKKAYYEELEYLEDSLAETMNKETRDNISYLKRKTNYFFTPTEIFARSFELYLINKGIKTSFLKDKEELEFIKGYPPVEDYFITQITEYFEKNLNLKLNLDFLTEEVPMFEIKNETNYEIEVITSGSGQVIFAI